MTISFSSSAGAQATPFESDRNALRFAHPYMVEFNGLMSRHLFILVPKNDTSWFCIYRFRFINTVKQERTNNSFEKSALVVRVMNDKMHELLTYVPTVQRLPHRLSLALCAMETTFKSFNATYFKHTRSCM